MISMQELAPVLRTARVFAAMNDADFDMLMGGLRARALSRGDVLFMAGDAGDAMVVVAQGDLKISLKGAAADSPLARLTAGDTVGEMACIDPAPRSATVTAIGPAIVVELSQPLLASMREFAPSVYSAVTAGVTAEVSARLRDTNALIADRLGHAHAASPARAPDVGRAHEGALDLRSIPLLRGLSGDDLGQLLAAAPAKAYPPGAWLCVEADAGRSCFLIVEGGVDVVRGEPGALDSLATLGVGSLVGQMSMVDHAPRSASVRANGQVVALELDRAAFERLVEAGGAMGLCLQDHIARAGVRQLRLANQRLGAAQRERTDPRQLAYMHAALSEWELTLEALEMDEDLEDVEGIVVSGLATAGVRLS